MNDILLNYLTMYKKNRLRRKKITGILFILSLCAALAVIWQLRFTGIAQTDVPCCGLEEHHHTPECLERRLICTQPEMPSEDPSALPEEGHVHTDACFEEVLVCEKEEHEHTLACYADPTADVETPEQWEGTLPSFSGMSWGEKVAAAAQSQLGYRESEKNYILAEDGVTKKGYTRYGEWYGSPYSDWSTLFASFCLHYAGIPETAVPNNSGAYALRTQADEIGILVADPISPKIGDILFIREDGMENASRCAVVTAVSSPDSSDTAAPVIEAIEGDRDGAVQSCSYSGTDMICGYISLQKAFERAAELELLPQEEAFPDPGPTDFPVTPEPPKTTPAPSEHPPEDPLPSDIPSGTQILAESPLPSSEPSAENGKTPVEPVCGSSEKSFSFGELQLNIKLSGTIAFPKIPELSERLEESSFDPWQRIGLSVYPVSETAAQAFAEYAAANYPTAASLTLLKPDCHYGGEPVDTSEAPMLLNVTASQSTTACAFSDGPFIQNVPVMEGTTAEADAAETPKTAEAASSFRLIVLKQDVQGFIQPVAESSTEQTTGMPLSIDFEGQPGESYCIIQAAAEDDKPILNHAQWPAQWGMDMRSEAVDQAGNVTAPQFMLFSDPYFNTGTEGGSEDDYPKPEASLGYILTNYNFFIFDDLVATNHLVGSAAVQGNTFISKQPGGTGGGYIPLSNKAPSYFKGRIIKLADSYNGANFTQNELDPEKLQLNISETGHQTQVVWHNSKDTVLRFPTYFGSSNKANQDVVIEGDSGSTKNVHFPDSALTGDGTAAYKFTANSSGFIYSPYYYTDQYIPFEDFRSNLFSSDALHPEGIPVTKPTDLSNVPLVSDWQASDAGLKQKGYQWMKNTDGQLKLFVRMGNVFNVDDLENVQIILYPWQGLAEFPKEPELSSSPADRANWLCTQKINTVIQCDGNTAHLATANAQGTVIPSVSYYTGDLKGPFDPQCTSNASLFNAENVSTSSILLLPNAKEVSVALSATHVVAPHASVYVPKSDYYGCFVCEDLRSCADHHILPYDTSSTFRPIACNLSKMIDTGTVDENNDPIYRIPDGTEAETFQFKIRPYGFFKREATNDKSDRFAPDAAAFPYQADFQLQQEYLVENQKSSICIDSFTAEIDRYFEQLIRDLNCITTVADKAPYKGHYIFEVTEVPDTPGFIPDANKYYIGIELCHNEAWGYDATSLRHQDILQKPIKFYGAENGQPFEKDSIVFYNKLPPFVPQLPNTGASGLWPYWFVGTVLLCPLLLRLFRAFQKKLSKHFPSVSFCFEITQLLKGRRT